MPSTRSWTAAIRRVCAQCLSASAVLEGQDVLLHLHPNRQTAIEHSICSPVASRGMLETFPVLWRITIKLARVPVNTVTILCRLDMVGAVPSPIVQGPVTDLFGDDEIVTKLLQPIRIWQAWASLIPRQYEAKRLNHHDFFCCF